MIVRSGLVTAWRLATWPTRRSPLFENATTDGVVRLPSALGMTTASPPSITATHEFVVPRSIPTIFAIVVLTSSELRVAFKHEQRISDSLPATRAVVSVLDLR